MPGNRSYRFFDEKDLNLDRLLSRSSSSDSSYDEAVSSNFISNKLNVSLCYKGNEISSFLFVWF